LLKKVDTIDNWVREIIKDDPVRPELAAEFRINDAAEIYCLWDDYTLGAICCVMYTDGVPQSVSEMAKLATPMGDTAMFYTIWSYTRGSGGNLIRQASNSILQNKSNVKSIVTLSPKTEMAEKFHLKNGAWKLRENTDTVNFAYKIDDQKD